MISGAERIYKKLQEAYPNGMATISDLSRNTTDQKDFIVCNHRAFNFDLVNNIGLNGSKPRKEKTPDALFSKGQRLFFVEFKEGSCDKNEIRQKIYEGITALYHFSMQNNIMNRGEFMEIEIGYVVINRYYPKGSPGSEILETLERSLDFFCLKNIEGFIVAKTDVKFTKKSIFEFLKLVTGGIVNEIEYVGGNGVREKICA